MGAKATVAAKVVDEKGGAVDVPVAFDVADAKIATVDAKTGDVVAVAAGETQVNANAAGIKATVKVAVVLPVVATVEADKELTLKVGAAPVKVKAAAKDADGKEIATATLSYSSADAKVATVDASGMVTPVGKGKTKLTVTSGEKTATVEVKVSKK